MRTLTILIFITLNSWSFAQSFLSLPIDGTKGKDWLIVNYVDWETAGFKDHHCGSKSYDGHQGTDFVIRSFKHMDSGVNVLAAASGRITFIQDGGFDRETEGDSSKKFGNYITIKHPNNYYSYYAHLKKNSIKVSLGDSVTIGEVIGQVGSSGNSTDPHLHFELWFDSLYVVDPFTGVCGNPLSLWNFEPQYDTTSGLLSSGLTIGQNLLINDLRERTETIGRPYKIKPSSDSSLYFWSHLYGMRKGKELSLRWTNPTDQLWFKYDFTLSEDSWYFYYWSYIDHKNLDQGKWHADLYYDNKIIASEEFNVKGTLSMSTPLAKESCQKLKNQSIEELITNQSLELQIQSIYGNQIQKVNHQLKGVYIISITQDNQTCRLKRLFN